MHSYRGEQETHRGHHHMVQQQSPEAKCQL